MSALLDTQRDGRASMAYTGELPWHRSGQALTAGADLETWRREAGLEWHVEKRPLSAHLESGVVSTVPGHKALVRSDTAKVLSLVSDRYVPHQPKEIVEFFSDLVSDFGFEMHTMGALAEGKQVWALAKANWQFNIGSNDAVDNFLLLATSFDKTRATQALYTPIRVVCNNTLSLALDRGSNAVKASHRAGLDEKAMKAELGLFSESAERFQVQAEAMAHHDLRYGEFEQFIDRVFQIDRREILDQGDDLPYPVRRCATLFTDGPGANLPAARGTLWGAFNAVTRFQDHEAKSRDGGRWRSATFGGGARRKLRAWELAGELTAA